jgi:hypothetical protein
MFTILDAAAHAGRINVAGMRERWAVVRGEAAHDLLRVAVTMFDLLDALDSGGGLRDSWLQERRDAVHQRMTSWQPVV